MILTILESDIEEELEFLRIFLPEENIKKIWKKRELLRILHDKSIVPIFEYKFQFNTFSDLRGNKPMIDIILDAGIKKLKHPDTARHPNKQLKSLIFTGNWTFKS